MMISVLQNVLWKKEKTATKYNAAGIVRVVTRRKENARVGWNRGIGSKCFLKRDKFPFVREDICKIYDLGSCKLAADLKHTGIGGMAMTSQ